MGPVFQKTQKYQQVQGLWQLNGKWFYLTLNSLRNLTGFTSCSSSMRMKASTSVGRERLLFCPVAQLRSGHGLPTQEQQSSGDEP
jgi:hypothetical protein